MSSNSDYEYPRTAPIPVGTGSQRWRDTFSSLRVKNFRLFTVANILGTTALWMQRIAQDWIVFELTNSVVAVGITVAMQFAPMLFLGLYGGVIVDRYSKRLLLLITQSVVGALSILLTILYFSGGMEAWHVYLVAFIGGLATVVDNPARLVLVNEIVGHDHLRNAISINSSVFQLGGLVGPAVAGILLVTSGAGWAFALNAAACFATVSILAMLNTSAMTRASPPPREKGELRKGIRYAAEKPTIAFPLIVLGFIAIFAVTMPVILAAYADEVFLLGAGGYGLFNTLVATGALVGGIASTRLSKVRLRGVILVAVVWGGVQATTGLMPNVVLFSSMLVVTGFVSLIFYTSINSLIQLNTNVVIRGRVMALYMLILLGGRAIGTPLMGLIVTKFGAHAGLVLSGLIPMVAAAVVGILLARRGKLTLAIDWTHPRTFLRIRKQPGTAGK